jgi:molybdopterin/thiamine biosynthesis adenylyltransferase
MEDEPLYPEQRLQFRQGLIAFGFTAVEEDRYQAQLEVHWQDPETGSEGSRHHHIEVRLDPSFPFSKPTVFPLDQDPPIQNERHQDPAEGGALCLYAHDEAGWMPWMTAQELVDRIRLWFVHYHRDDWPVEDRPPDLHLYFPESGTRALMLIGEDWQPPAETANGRFALWQRVPERAFAGNPTAGTETPRETNNDPVLKHIRLAERPRDHVGLWFRLTREPQPRMTLEALLEEIDAAAGQPPGWARTQVSSLAGHRIRKQDFRLVLALGYPDATGETQWLFLHSALPAAEKGAKNWHQRLDQITIGSYETARVGPAALMRRTAHTSQQLADSSILIFGQGAIGSSIALLLAKAGVGSLSLVDSARLRPGNAVRHAAGLTYVGKLKTVATTLEILEHAPDCRVTRHGATWGIGQLRSWIQSTDLVVDAAANPGFSFLLNELALRAAKPVLYVAAYRRAAIGRLRVVRPGQDACLICYEGGQESYSGRLDYPRIPPVDEGEFIESGCGVPTVEASAVDTEATANVAARGCLWLLQNKLQDENQCLVVNDILPDAGGVLRQVGLHWQHWPPLPRCSSCGKVKP